MRPRAARFLRLLVLLPSLLAAGCAGWGTPTPTAGPATPTAVPGELTLVAPLALDRARVGAGETIVGGVTYANLTATPIAVRELLIALRPPGEPTPAGDRLRFSPTLGAATVAPGERVTLVATHTPGPGDPAGEWRAFSSWQDAAGNWHEADQASLFAVGPAATGPGGTTAGVGATVAPLPPGFGAVGPTTPAIAPALAAPTTLYWGAYVDGAPWDLGALDAFEARAGKGVSILHWGQAWWRDGRYQPFYASDFDRARARGAIPLLDWASWDYCCGPDQPAFSLAAIARGEHDAYIRAWAEGAKAWGQPFFLRFNWEMNGWWRFPWSEQLNGNRPGDYVRAWRRVHDLFREVGATNVTWVWCPNVVVPGTTPLADLYPGDAYVDWVAMDGHNWGGEYGNSWQSFAAIFAPTYAALQRLAPTKPIMLGEVASVEQGGDKAAWIRDAFGAQLPARFPAIKAVVWFEWDDDDPRLTWPIASSAAASRAFAEVVGGSATYLPNRFGDLATTPIPIPPPLAPGTAAP